MIAVTVIRVQVANRSVALCPYVVLAHPPGLPELDLANAGIAAALADPSTAAATVHYHCPSMIPVGTFLSVEDFQAKQPLIGKPVAYEDVIAGASELAINKLSAVVGTRRLYTPEQRVRAARIRARLAEWVAS